MATEPLPQAGKFDHWIGRQTRAGDVVTERLVASFRAIFEPYLAAVPEDAAPFGLHWCLCPPIAGMAALGPDGHPAKDGDLPPIPLPRRMWAGGTLQTFDSLRVGDRVERVSTIAGIDRKQGRTGELWFLALDHDYVTERGVAIRERQDIVYREAAMPGRAGARPAPASTEPERPQGVVWTLATPPTLLFRYSAITFNGHRIHYDLPYVRGTEGYEGLVVHGPIQATLLLNLAATVSGKIPHVLKYRGIAPAIAGPDLRIVAGAGTSAGQFWTQGPGGVRHMEATAS